MDSARFWIRSISLYLSSQAVRDGTGGHNILELALCK